MSIIDASEHIIKTLELSQMAYAECRDILLEVGEKILAAEIIFKREQRMKEKDNANQKS